MEIDDNAINHLEELSKLSLTYKEKTQIKTDLISITNFMDKLNELDTGKIEELSHPFQETNRFREDIQTKSYNRKEMLLNANTKLECYFIAPKTI